MRQRTLFIIGRGRRDDSTNGMVICGSNGGARGDVHRSCQCAATADNEAPVETSIAVASADSMVACDTENS